MYLQEPFNILIDDIAVQKVAEARQAGMGDFEDLLQTVTGLDFFINPVFDEDAFQRFIVKAVFPGLQLQLQFTAQEFEQLRCCAAELR